MFDKLSVKIAGAYSKVTNHIVAEIYEVYKIALRLSMLDNFFNDFTIQVHNFRICELCAQMRSFANLAAEVTEFALILGIYPSAILQHCALQ